MVQFEFQQKDYAGAIRDLSKINYGPYHEQSQSLIQEAKSALPGANMTDSRQQLLLQAAQAAYQRGDFDAAAAQASRIQSPALQPVAKQLLTNIKVYQDTMTQGELLARNGDYLDRKSVV